MKHGVAVEGKREAKENGRALSMHDCLFTHPGTDSGKATAATVDPKTSFSLHQGPFFLPGQELEFSI